MDPTTQAALDESWLRERLGRRYYGVQFTLDGEWVATAERSNGKLVWCPPPPLTKPLRS